MPELEAAAIAAELIAVVVAVADDRPLVLTIRDARALPSGPFVTGHRSLQAGVRSWVEAQTHHPLGYVEQLYTFADPDRAPGAAQRIVSICYLGLTRQAGGLSDSGAGWQDWYRYFPWEDRRAPASAAAQERLLAPLLAWAEAGEDWVTRRERHRRVATTFGLDGERWNEELVLQRYELLWEARLVPEAGGAPATPGAAMLHDHRRILATGIARLRAKIKYRPVVFELMPPTFTLLALQRAVEALAGHFLHKQNFRRLVEQQDLVEESGGISTGTSGRPAKLFRFKREVLAERAAAGSKLPLAR